MTTVLSIHSFRGGTGKSNTTSNLAAQLAARGHRVAVIDTARNRVIARVRVGQQPTRVATDPDGTRAYVANFGSGTITVLDGRTGAVRATWQVGEQPTVPVVDVKGRRIITALAGEDRVVALDYDTGAVLDTAPTGSRPWGVLANADVSRVYTPDFGADTISVVCTTSPWTTATLQAQAQPVWLVGGPYLYAMNAAASSVSVYATDQSC